MRSIACVAALFYLIFPLAEASQRSVFDLPRRPQLVRTRILAISSSVHTGSSNQEVYLADVVQKDGVHRLAKLIDRYPDYGSPIPLSVLKERPLLEMKVIRDPSCDSVNRDFFLSTDERRLFDAGARVAITDDPTSPLPCFKTEHLTIQFAKKSRNSSSAM